MVRKLPEPTRLRKKLALEIAEQVCWHLKVGDENQGDVARIIEMQLPLTYAEAEAAMSFLNDLEVQVQQHPNSISLPDQLRDTLGLDRTIRLAELFRAAIERVTKLQAFKDWVHSYLDAHGVPQHPPGSHGAEGCRIGDRMDWLLKCLEDSQAEVTALRQQVIGHCDRIAAQSELLTKRALKDPNPGEVP